MDTRIEGKRPAAAAGQQIFYTGLELRANLVLALIYFVIFFLLRCHAIEIIYTLYISYAHTHTYTSCIKGFYVTLHVHFPALVYIL